MKEPLIYRIGISTVEVIVPRGFVTDFASIPPALQSFIQPNGPYSLPAVVHDYLYWMQACTREQSDAIFRLAMIEHKVPTLRREEIYRGVRLGGAAAWTANAEARRTGFIRTLPERVISPPTLTAWTDYQAMLRRNGVAGAFEPAVSQAFCERGSMPDAAALGTR